MLALAVFSVHLNALPWNEPSRSVPANLRNLPEGIADSIMARGNWQLLFPQNKFRDFQRTLTGAEQKLDLEFFQEAETEIQKAHDQLELIYAEIRGKYGWPKDIRQLRSTGKLLGEEAESFTEIQLARIQILTFEERLLTENQGYSADYKKKLTEIDRLLQDIPRETTAYRHLQKSKLLQYIEWQKEMGIFFEKGKFPGKKLEEFFQDRRAVMSESPDEYWSLKIRKSAVFHLVKSGNCREALYLIDENDSNENLFPYLTSAKYRMLCLDFTGAANSARLVFADNLLPNKYNLRYRFLAYYILQNIEYLKRNYAKAAAFAQSYANDFIVVERDPTFSAEERTYFREQAYILSLTGVLARIRESGLTDELSKELSELQPDEIFSWPTREKYMLAVESLDIAAFSYAVWSQIARNASVANELSAAARFHVAQKLKKSPDKKVRQEWITLWQKSLPESDTAQALFTLAVTDYLPPSPRNQAKRLEANKNFLKSLSLINADLMFIRSGLYAKATLTDILENTFSKIETGADYREIHTVFGWAELYAEKNSYFWGLADFSSNERISYYANYIRENVFFQNRQKYNLAAVGIDKYETETLGIFLSSELTFVSMCTSDSPKACKNNLRKNESGFWSIYNTYMTAENKEEKADNSAFQALKQVLRNLLADKANVSSLRLYAGAHFISWEILLADVLVAKETAVLRKMPEDIFTQAKIGALITNEPESYKFMGIGRSSESGILGFGSVSDELVDVSSAFSIKTLARSGEKFNEMISRYEDTNESVVLHQIGRAHV